MAKTFEKAVAGFNHNIKHKGKLYHVQTEDSGASNPHIITHLFVGGNILATKKVSYADIVNSQNLAQLVREMMEQQHKQMLRNLVNGIYDAVDRGATAYQPGELALDGAKGHSPSPVEVANQGAAVPKEAGAGVPAPEPKALPPEVIAARALEQPPKENNVGLETLFGEDLISEKSLDEVILSYLSGRTK